jgi:hypothetical protein
VSELITGRRFQLWEYHVSHGSLLIRSPADSRFETSIDLVFAGTQYVSLPRHLGEIKISAAGAADQGRVEKLIDKDLRDLKVWVLENACGRHFVAAAALQIAEHHGEIFDSPLLR